MGYDTMIPQLPVAPEKSAEFGARNEARVKSFVVYIGIGYNLIW